MLRNKILARLRSGSIPSGQSLKLRKDVYKQLKEREWIFNRAEEEIIFLIHKSGAYGVVVKTWDIDWSEC